MSILSRPKRIPDSAFLDPHHDVSDDGLRAIYMFELPVRVAHWLLFFSIVALSVTGFWIYRADTPATPIGRPDMAMMRAVHVAAGWAMILAMTIRVIWLFTGNEWSNWREWIPSSKKRLGELVNLLRFYLFFRPTYPEGKGGHNVMAGLSYTVVYGILSFMALSGLALHADPSGADWHATVAAPVAWISLPTLRLLHHAGMWIIWMFTVMHVALVTLVDAETRGDVLSAIFSGWRPRISGPQRAGLVGKRKR